MQTAVPCIPVSEAALDYRENMLDFCSDRGFFPAHGILESPCSQSAGCSPSSWNGPPCLVSFLCFWCWWVRKSASNPQSSPSSASIHVLGAVRPPVQTAFPVSHCAPADSETAPACLRPVPDYWNLSRRNLKTHGCRSLPPPFHHLTVCTDFVAHTAAATTRFRRACSRSLLI